MFMILKLTFTKKKMGKMEKTENTEKTEKVKNKLNEN